MRDKVLEAIARYAEGGSIGQHLDAVKLKRGDFYAYKRKNPDVAGLYLDVQQARADMMVDEAYEIGSDKELNPQLARVQAEIRLKIAAAFHRERFGDKVTLEHEIKPSLVAAIDEGKRRAALPQRDPAIIIDAQYTEIQPIARADTSDKQSAAPPFAIAPGDVDPFAP